jgi:hypothetical protein
MSRLDSAGAACGCLGALVAGDLALPDGAGGGGGNASRADALLPLFVPGERAQARRAWLADVLIALLQRAQVTPAGPSCPAAFRVFQGVLGASRLARRRAHRAAAARAGTEQP